MNNGKEGRVSDPDWLGWEKRGTKGRESRRNEGLEARRNK